MGDPMSIRVNKIIGYGLDDLNTKPRDSDRSSHVPDDPRWDYASYLARWKGDVEQERDIAAYKQWCEENKERLIALSAAEGWSGDSIQHFLMIEGLKDRIQRKKQERSWTAPYSAVNWDSEFGLKNVVLFYPPEHCHNWRRHDDIIDYYEEMDAGGTRRRATRLPGSSGIFPYNGFLRRFRDPSPDVAERLSKATRLIRAFSMERPAENRERDGAEITRLDGGRYNQLIGAWDPEVPPALEDEVLLKHFREDWRPQVPLGVLAVIEYLGCFPDAFGPSGIVNSLRPMVYVYWS